MSSIVRCSKIMTINKNKLIARVAKLDEEETQNVLEVVCRYIVD